MKAGLTVLSQKNPTTSKEPRTVGAEPIERLAKVFVMPTTKPLYASGGFIARAEASAAQESADARTSEYLEETRKFIDDGKALGCDDCSDCETSKDDQAEGTSDDLLEGVSIQLDFLDQGDLRRAHELDQFVRGQMGERECELYGLRCEINEALDNGVEFDEILELDDRDVMHTAVNRVRRELGLDD